jgi:hypothetical protein
MTKTSSVALMGADRFLQNLLYGAETEDLHPTDWRNRQSSPARTAFFPASVELSGPKVQRQTL